MTRQPGPPPITRAGGRLPYRPVNSCGYQQGEPSPYLVSRVLLEELDFRSLQGISRPTHKYQARRTPVESTCPAVPIQYPARAPLGHPTPYL